MPLLTNPPKVDVPVTVNATGRVVSKELKTALVETKFQPLNSLLTHIEGSILICTYYRQLVDSDDKLQAQQLTLDPQYQQYDRIRQMETRQQGDWSFSVDDDSKERTLTGETIIYPSFPPNFGDMFLADSGDGRQSVFTVTGAVPLSWLKQTCYRVQFSKVGYLTKEREDDFKRKTVGEYTFVKDFVNHGKYPIIIDEQYRSYRDLAKMYKTMQSDYLRTFFSEVCQTFIVPNQFYVTFDPFLTKAVMALLEVDQHLLARKVNQFHLDNDYAFRTTTIWDSLLMVDESHMHVSAWRMGSVSKLVLYDTAVNGGPYWTAIQRIMYPIDTRTDADRLLAPSAKGRASASGAYRLTRSNAAVTDFDRLVLNKDLRDVETVAEFPEGYLTPDIHRVTDDETYVFSKAFYQRDAEHMSKLEKLTWSLLNHEEIDVEILEDLVSQSMRWDNLERFYFVPVLMILCTIALRGPSST